MSEHVFAIQELAEYLSLSRTTLLAIAKKGEIPAAKIGRSWHFFRPAINRWLEELVLNSLCRSIEKKRNLNSLLMRSTK